MLLYFSSTSLLLVNQVPIRGPRGYSSGFGLVAGPSRGNANDVTPSSTGAPPIAIGERVVILTDEGPEYGTVRWVGRIASRWHAGVDFVSFIPFSFVPPQFQCKCVL